MNEPQVVGLVLTLVGKRRVSVTELTHYEPEDRSVGIFGNYIEVKATDDIRYVLDDGTGWVHRLSYTDKPCWGEIIGTFDASKVWPSQDKPITPRAILKATDSIGQEELSHSLVVRWNEQLELKWGIGLDTELRQA